MRSSLWSPVLFPPVTVTECPTLSSCSLAVSPLRGLISGFWKAVLLLTDCAKGRNATKQVGQGRGPAPHFQACSTPESRAHAGLPCLIEVRHTCSCHVCGFRSWHRSQVSCQNAPEMVCVVAASKMPFVMSGLTVLAQASAAQQGRHSWVSQPVWLPLSGCTGFWFL